MRSLRLRPAFTPGAILLTIVAVANLLLWTLARPAGQPTGRYAGEVCGAEVVLLLACSLVLATLFPAIERAFFGLDRVAVWHRRAATAGVLLLVPHVLWRRRRRTAMRPGSARGSATWRYSVFWCCRCGRLHRD
jgi:predicted ferric reductase